MVRDGEAVVTITRPGLFAVDINGQMDDQDTGRLPGGHHAGYYQVYRALLSAAECGVSYSPGSAHPHRDRVRQPLPPRQALALRPGRAGGQPRGRGAQRGRLVHTLLPARHPRHRSQLPSPRQQNLLHPRWGKDLLEQEGKAEFQTKVRQDFTDFTGFFLVENLRLLTVG